MATPDINLLTQRIQASSRPARYKYIWQHFILFCSECELNLTIGNELQWLESLKDQGKSAATIRLYAYAVKALLMDNLEVSGMTESQIAIEKYKMELEFRAFRMPRVVNRKHKERLITEDELQQVLSKSRVKTKVIIEFLATTGCRVSEVTGIRLSHVHKVRDDEHKIRIMGKGRKERLIIITGSLRKRIYKAFPETKVYLFESAPGQSYSRQTIHQLVQRAGNRVRIKGLHPHSFRHYFATQMIDKTGDIEAVSEYLGHSDVSTTLGMYYHNKKLTIEQLTFDLYGKRRKNKGDAAHA